MNHTCEYCGENTEREERFCCLSEEKSSRGWRDGLIVCENCQEEYSDILIPFEEEE